MAKDEHNSSESEVVFFDDFSSIELDRSKWNVRITGKPVNNELQAYVESSETIYTVSEEDAPGITSGGALVLHPRYHAGFTTPEGDSFDFISGRIDTRDTFEFMYGMAAARMQLAAGPGLWPAFWALGKGQWPGCGEIDIMENVGEPDWVSAGVHGPNYFGESGLVNNLYLNSENNATQWHVYSVEWHPDKLIFKVDDEIVYRVTQPMVEFYGEWVFDNPKYLILNFALGGTYPFKINGIQTPYYGMPEGTVDSIQEDQARVLIDWVKVKAYAASMDG